MRMIPIVRLDLNERLSFKSGISSTHLEHYLKKNIDKIAS